MNKEYIEKLANELYFNLTEDEKEEILSSFADYEKEIKELHGLTITEESAFHPHTLYEATLREDINVGSDKNEDLFRNTNHFIDQEIEVPKVVG